MKLFVIMLAIFMIAPQALSGVGIEDDARSFVNLLDQGRFDEAIECYSPEIKKAISSSELRDLWTSLILQLGEFEEINGVRLCEVGGYTKVEVRCEFAD